MHAAPGVSFSFFPRRPVGMKAARSGKEAAIPAVLVPPGFEISNLRFQASSLIKEFGADTLLFRDGVSIFCDGCKKIREILNGVIGEGPFLKIFSGIRGIGSH